MTAPPGLAPTLEAAPEHIGRAGNLPRQVRDEVARRFMADFGMTGAQAVRWARTFLNDQCVADEHDRIDMSREALARFMAQAPNNVRRGECGYARSVRKPRGQEAR